MPRIASTILPPNIHDLRFRIFCLGFEGGDQRVVCVHHDVVDLPLVLEADGEFHRHHSSVRARALNWYANHSRGRSSLWWLARELPHATLGPTGRRRQNIGLPDAVRAAVEPWPEISCWSLVGNADAA